MSQIVMGQYYPGDSLVHRMDPRAKWLFLMVFMIFVFWANHLRSTAVLLFFTLVAAGMARIPVSVFIRAIRPALFIILFTMILHLLMTKGGEALLRLPFITIYQEGLRQAVFVSARLFVLISVASLLTFTTSPIDLTDGIEWLLKPLQRFKIPVHEIALMMSIALRFIPLLWEETEKIRKAQTARGADFDTGFFIKRLKSYIPVLIPLFLSAFRRAEELALAMEARGYRGSEGRTKWRQLRFSSLDGWLLIVAVLLFFVLRFLE
ncbi:MULTISPECIES: energy-coupling factor transporter transmembrane protein EcfT [Thermoactinomyces]|jgi:energy-coupling factor transport system permease protein|uniref:Energy-coupling factor transporter transmembrane protein EcfT n=1 Tax=Thermoactinomyces daqus TaxID=1329516 RepID=A0A7W2AHM7_9BACL|nr:MULTISPECIES: energy-coupling factor transporter transmembrane component T [Thermoactinomyces]MBA4542325.1 energy-coupling factor transporter transmembrane protein EcfT [Thermoactinomyces daqus]MBH8598888.1 energy-coupling factor transporter transmembrane protein EcfT [Thermoactinomyces sp. CICC 10523]